MMIFVRPYTLTPAQAGVQPCGAVDPGFRRDEW